MHVFAVNKGVGCPIYNFYGASSTADFYPTVKVALRPESGQGHHEHTHPEQWAAVLLRRPGSSWGFGAFSKGSHLSHGIEDGKGYSVYSLLPPTIPAGTKTRTRNLWVTSPTLTIRPRLPWFILYLHINIFLKYIHINLHNTHILRKHKLILDVNNHD